MSYRYDDHRHRVFTEEGSSGNPTNQAVARPLELAEWVVATCLMFGATTTTAYQIAGLFVKEIENDRGTLDRRAG